MKNNLTDRMKSLLLRQKMSLNEDELLYDIFSELPPEKKKNKYLFIMLTLGLIFSALTFYTLSTHDGHIGDIQGIEKDHTNDISASGPNEETEILESRQTFAYNSSLEKAEKVGLSDFEINKLKNEKELELQSSSVANINKPTARALSPKKVIKNLAQQETILNAKKDVNLNKASESTTPLLNNLLSSIPKTNNSTLVMEALEDNIIQSKTQDQTINFKENKDDISGNKVNALGPLYQRALLPFLIENDIFYLNNSMTTSPMLSDGFDVSKLQLELNGQGFYQKVDLKNIQPRPGYQIQVLAKYKIRKFAPIIGLSFKRMNSVLDHTWIEERNTLSSNEASMFCPDDPSGCLTYNDITQTTRHVAYNHIDVIDIPIGIEYQSAGRISWWGRMLINIPIESSFKFEYLDANDNIVDLRKIENAKVDIAPEIQLSTGVAYRVFNNIDIRVGLHHNYSTKGIGISPATFSIPKSSIGGQLGINYWIR